MTFVANQVNTNVVIGRATITDVIDPHDKLVSLLRELMQKGLSQQAIADQTHGAVSQSAISAYLTGTRRAKLESALAIGKPFGKGLAFFTDAVEDEAVPPILAEYIKSLEGTPGQVPKDVAEEMKRSARLLGGEWTWGAARKVHELAVELLSGRVQKEEPPLPEGKRRLGGKPREKR